MEAPAPPAAGRVVRRDAWTLTETADGFELVIHPERGRRWLAMGLRLAITAAVVAVLIDICVARGIRPAGFVGGAIGGMLPALLAQLRRIKRQDERLVLAGDRLTHTGLGLKGKEETVTTPLGPDVEIDLEPRHLADGVVDSLSPPPRALTIHSNGRTVGVGHAVPTRDGAALHAALDARVAPERRPVPGRPGAVRVLAFPVETGSHRQLRYVGRQRSSPAGSVGALSSVVLVLSLIAVFLGSGFTLARWMSGGTPRELEWTAAILGAAGVATLLPRRGLLDRWRDRVLAESPAPQGARVLRTATYRLSRTSAVIGLPVVGGIIAWAGTPRSPVLVPVWLALVVLALVPMSIYLWQIAFAGTTEVSVPAPLVPGQPAELRFALHRNAAPFSSIAFRLVRTELRRSTDLLQFGRFWTTHEGVHHLPADTPAPGPNEEVAALFDIPADAGGSDDGGTPPITWFLEVRGVTSAGAYIEAFPVPVVPPLSAGSGA